MCSQTRLNALDRIPGHPTTQEEEEEEKNTKMLQLLEFVVPFWGTCNVL